jgi:hypothetical protein
MLPLPTEPSVRNSLTAVFTVAGIGTTTRETKGIVDEPRRLLMSANPLAAVIFLVLGYMWKNLLGESLMATLTGIDLDSISRGSFMTRGGTN